MSRKYYVLCLVSALFSFSPSAKNLRYIYNSTADWQYESFPFAETVWLEAFNKHTQKWEAKQIGDWSWTRRSIDSQAMILDAEKYSQFRVHGYEGTGTSEVIDVDNCHGESMSHGRKKDGHITCNGFEYHAYVKKLHLCLWEIPFRCWKDF
ncbi:MAG: hypothetical protein ACPGUD_04715 [Parashewanella sp.]